MSLTVSKNLRNFASLDIYTKILQESTYNQFEIRVNINLLLCQRGIEELIPKLHPVYMLDFC